MDGNCGAGAHTIGVRVTDMFTTIAPVTLNEGASRTVTLAATDPDSDLLSYSLITPPAFVTLTDGGAEAEQSFSVTVMNVNRGRR